MYATPHDRWQYTTSLLTVLLTAGLLLAALAVPAEELPLYPDVPGNETPLEALERIQEAQLIVNAHEHAENIDDVERLQPANEAHGIGMTVLLGSSHFTITLNPRVGFTRYDEYNDNMLEIAQEYPDHFQAWPTISPTDPMMVTKLDAYMQQGASGLKLYTGHGYVSPVDNTYLFHPIAMDDARMFPLYEYLEKNNVPTIWHVNPYKIGFAQEFIEVLRLFPDMRVICPHFMLSSIKDSRLREYLDTFPNLYSDVSFGHDDFLIAGLKRISGSPDKFRDIFNTYPDRFMFGTDLVVTNHPVKTTEWLGERMQAYLDMLTKETYTVSFIKGDDGEPAVLNGLEITSPLLDNILYHNFNRFMASDPEGTEITREINWSRIDRPKMDRDPGQAYPPDTEGN
ncbi:MAG: amidohydrolase family protein [Candidatus Hydrogenedentota bacterium]